MERFELNLVLLVIISKDETSGSVSTEGSLESVKNNVLGFPVILVGDLFAEVFLRDVGLALMEDVEDEFLSGQQFVDSKTGRQRAANGGEKRRQTRRDRTHDGALQTQRNDAVYTQHRSSRPNRPTQVYP